ncbi:MAG: transporter substrate-binding domain-containing protein [Ruminococcaceae bacterium]|nr:transporter substrate-binding domain-containing protein [Oscillospiraceae bacterium]
MKKLMALTLAVLMLLSTFAGCTVEESNGPGENTYNLTTVKEGYLTVLTSPDYAPYEFYALDESGNPTLAGFDMALAKYIADYLGLTLEVVPMDFKGIPDELGAGAADLALAGLSPDPDRLLKMDFSDIYYEGKQAFVTVSSKAGQFTDLASTNSAEFTIAAQTGTIQMELAQEFSPNADIVNLTKATDIIAELISGQIDGAYIEWDVAAAYKLNYPELEILFEVPYEAEGNVIGVSKGNADLLKYVNKALHKCIDDGSFAKFLEEANNLAAGDNYQGMLDENGKVPTEGEAG